MSKKVLILSIGCSLPPWATMRYTAAETWDSFEVDGVETMFYYGEPVKPNTPKDLFFPIPEGYNNMGHKMLAAFEWVLANKEFDYINRINSSCYVDKHALIKAVQLLPQSRLFAGLKVFSVPMWLWGGGQFMISRDVVEKIVENKHRFRHDLMEDVALSYLVRDAVGVTYSDGMCASVDKTDDGWRCMMYGYGDSFEFTEWADLEKARGQYNFRVKQDGARHMDRVIMQNLFEVLNK